MFRSAHRPPDWRGLRDTIDLAALATALLGPPPGRRGEHGLRLWWPCPFHDDHNPSLCVRPGDKLWRCFGCDEKGDAISLIRRLDPTLTFRQAVDIATGRRPAAPRSTAAPRPDREAPAAAIGPEGMTPEAAAELVAEAADRLWSPDGAGAIAHLTGPARRLLPQTIRAAHLGWTPAATARTRDGRRYRAEGIVVPWFAGDSLCLVKLRQPEGRRPKYCELFRDSALLALYPGPEAVRPGRLLVVVEGEFDCLLLAQELGELAGVTTLGSASARPDVRVLSLLLAARPWFLATDADAAGDRTAAAWPASARRVPPPRPYKDWCDAASGPPGVRGGGVDLRRWWGEVLAGRGAGPAYAWGDLAGWRWGPAADDAAGGRDVVRPAAEADLAAILHDGAMDPDVPAEREAIRAEVDR